MQLSHLTAFAKKHALVLLVLLAVVAFLVWNSIARTKKEKEAEIATIRQQLATGVGANGQDIKALVSGITPTPGYNATALARSIHDAHGAFLDDEEAVFTAFRNKSIGQIAAIVRSFQSQFGLDIDRFLLRGDSWSEFLSQSEYEQIVAIVHAARLAANI